MTNNEILTFEDIATLGIDTSDYPQNKCVTHAELTKLNIMNPNDTFPKGYVKFELMPGETGTLTFNEAVNVNSSNSSVYTKFLVSKSLEDLARKYMQNDNSTLSSVTLSQGETVYAAIKCAGLQGMSLFNKNIYQLITGTARYKVSGNLMALAKRDNLSQSYFYLLFYSCTNLIEADGLILPHLDSSNFTANWYNGTFRNCNNLQKAPILTMDTVSGDSNFIIAVR